MTRLLLACEVPHRNAQANLYVVFSRPANVPGMFSVPFQGIYLRKFVIKKLLIISSGAHGGAVG